MFDYQLNVSAYPHDLSIIHYKVPVRISDEHPLMCNKGQRFVLDEIKECQEVGFICEILPN